MRQTRIIATVGPASRPPGILATLIEAGVDVFRVNCSHGTTEENAELVREVRAAVDTSGRLVAVLADLQGPKIHVGQLDAPIEMVTGTEVVFRAGADTYDGVHIPVEFPEFADDVGPGDAVLLHDGLLEVVVTGVNGTDVTGLVVCGGPLGSRKGINLPGAGTKTRAPTPKDLEDLEAVLEAGTDFVALSFVRSAHDIARLRGHIVDLGHDVPVVAKLERPEAVDEMEAIIATSDIVMVARGDLGIELEPARVPILQKRIIQTANRLGRQVIVATEMLESMLDQPRPTRAEVSDVANAILDGADALMLSEETAIGLYPVAAVRGMARICELTEAATHPTRNGPPSDRPRPRAVAAAACRVCEELDAVAIIVHTSTGLTSQLVATFRPSVPVLALSPSLKALRRMRLQRGVQAEWAPPVTTFDDLVAVANDYALHCGIAREGELIVMLGGTPGEIGGTDRMIVHQLRARPHDRARLAAAATAAADSGGSGGEPARARANLVT